MPNRECVNYNYYIVYHNLKIKSIFFYEHRYFIKRKDGYKGLQIKLAEIAGYKNSKKMKSVLIFLYF